jgi:GNAT superfamily N-acetyltransferase
VARIRLATRADADAVARVHVASWQAAYRGLLPDEYLDSLQWEQRYDFWAKELETPGSAGSQTWVLVSELGVLGFASVGPARDDDRQSAGCWEVYGIYLLPDQWGQGNGHRLMERALRATASEVGDVSLWVLAGNQRARSFYERQGFRPDGHRRAEVIGGREVVEVRYQR